MLEERNEGFISTGEMVEQPGEREDGPTSIDVADKEISIGEVPVAVSQEEKLQEQVQVQQELKISKRKQKRRITSYLSNISKQIEKNGNQINKITMMVQSIQKQKQTKSTKGAGVSQSPLQSIKQIQSQVSQLQKQVTRIQKDIQRIRTTSGTGTSTKAKFRKLASSSANVKPRSKKSRSLKSNKMRRSRKSR
jgi:chromosome segregation ATPase